MLTKTDLKKFSLRDGTIRFNSEVHNGGWYNSNGEKIGWGDLNRNDFSNIKTNLNEGELFVVLPEQESFWNFVTEYAIVGSLCPRKPEEQNPGQDYIIKHARYIIDKNEVYYFDKYSSNNSLTDARKAEVIKAGT